MDGMARSGDTATRLASDHAPSRRPTERVAGLVAWRIRRAVLGILFTARGAAKAASRNMRIIFFRGISPRSFESLLAD
jgi:hypothetical protein